MGLLVLRATVHMRVMSALELTFGRFTFVSKVEGETQKQLPPACLEAEVAGHNNRLFVNFKY